MENKRQREIKFRAKRSYDKNWIYGFILNVDGIFHLIQKDDMREDGHHISQESDNPTWVYEDTIGQFTGLYDKNNTEIYEGDIIKYYSLKYDSGRCGGEPFITSNIHPVEFENGVFFCSNSKYNPLSQIGLFDLKQVQSVMPMYDDIDKGPFLDCAGTCANEHIIGIEVIGNIYDNPKILNKA